MSPRRRPATEPGNTQSELGPRVLTLDGLIGGYNGYTSPDLLTPQFWAQSSNVYAGQFGTIRRARWAPFLNSTATGFSADGFRIVSMYSMSDIINAVTWLMFDNNDTGAQGPRWLVQNPLANYQPLLAPLGQQAARLYTVYDHRSDIADAGVGGPIPPTFPNYALLNGPYARTMINNAVYEGNGLYRSKVLVGSPSVQTSNVQPPYLESWGIDSPDVSTSITLSAGFTKTIVAATGAVRANNIVTITTTAVHGLFSGQWIALSGVTDTTFNSAAGTAYLILNTPSPTTFTFAQVGSASTSGSGTVTYGITKTVGRSYAYAWENAITGHISAPSPVSQYVKYTSQIGTIDLVETGTINIAAGVTAVVGTNTNFSAAWVGKAVWCETISGIATLAYYRYVSSVTDATHMTLSSAFPAGVGNVVNSRFQIVDPQTTHVRLYATADAGAVYFLIARNQLNLFPGQLAAQSGLEFIDNANSEPPNPPFSSETEQIYNIPPPLGKFVDQYQGRAIIYGVPATPQTFYYTNIEATVVGVPPESSSPLNTVLLPIGDAALTGSANLPTGMVFWSNRQDMFYLTGLLSDNTIGSGAQLGATLQRLPYKIGCGSHYATTVTNLGAMWLSSDREVWLFTSNYAPKNIGKPVQDVLNRINGARLPFAKMTYYKRGDRSWLALAVALDSSTFNNKLLLLDLDLLASNGQPSFFTFDMATNAPTWYQFDINCEGLCTSYDLNSINHLFAADIDLITDVDWQPSYYTIGSENTVPGSITNHAFGNEDPHMIKTVDWMRVLTNQQPINLAVQNWQWNVLGYDDDKYVIGVNSLVTKCIPGVNSNSNPLFLEYSPAKFKFGGYNPVKGRRFQLQTIFPSLPGLYEFRGYQVSYVNVVGR